MWIARMSDGDIRLATSRIIGQFSTRIDSR